MTSFIVAIDGVDPSSEEEKTLQKYMAEEGFALSMVGGNRVRYALPGHIFHQTSASTIDQILDSAQRAAARTRSHCKIIAIEAASVAWAGLDMLGRDRSPQAAPAATATSVPSPAQPRSAAPAPTPATPSAPAPAAKPAPAPAPAPAAPPAPTRAKRRPSGGAR